MLNAAGKSVSTEILTRIEEMDGELARRPRAMFRSTICAGSTPAPRCASWSARSRPSASRWPSRAPRRRSRRPSSAACHRAPRAHQGRSQISARCSATAPACREAPPSRRPGRAGSRPAAGSTSGGDRVTPIERLPGLGRDGLDRAIPFLDRAAAAGNDRQRRRGHREVVSSSRGRAALPVAPSPGRAVYGPAAAGADTPISASLHRMPALLSSRRPPTR